MKAYKGVNLELSLFYKSFDIIAIIVIIIIIVIVVLP